MKPQLRIFTLLLIVLLAACGNEGDRYGRSDELSRALSIADDSIKTNSTAADSLLNEGLKRATDSLAFYDYYIRKLELQVFRQNGDTIGTEWNRAEAFLNKQPRSPRINGMRALLANIRGVQNHQLRRDHSITLPFYMDAYRWTMQSDIKGKAPGICANIGDEYLYANQLPTASSWYRRALFLADSLHIPQSQSADLKIGLAQIYVSLSDYGMAQACYEQIESKFDSLSTPMKGFFINSYGNYFYFKGDLKGSLKQFRRLEKFYRDTRQEGSLPMSICWLNMANIYADMKEDNLAEHYLRLAEPMIRQMKDEGAAYYIDNVRIALAAHRGDGATIRNILAATSPDIDVDYRSRNVRSRYLVDFYKQQGNDALALKELEAYNAGNDSLMHNQQHMHTADLMARHVEDTLRLHNEVLIAQKEAQVDYRNMWVGILVAIIVIIIVMAAYLLNRQKQKELSMSMQLQSMRLTMMRNRISPHFIFNVLNNSLSPKANTDDSIHRLAQLIRNSLDLTGRDSITLTEEMDFVNAYIDNVKASLGQHFEYHINTPATSVTDGIRLPSMLVEIMVENAVKHGLKARQDDGRLNIDISCNDDVCTVSVSDNGPGFDITKADPTSSHHGLNIIRNTLAVVNRGKTRKMRFNICNITLGDGTIGGCRSQLIIPISNN